MYVNEAHLARYALAVFTIHLGAFDSTMRCKFTHRPSAHHTIFLLFVNDNNNDDDEDALAFGQPPLSRHPSQMLSCQNFQRLISIVIVISGCKKANQHLLRPLKTTKHKTRTTSQHHQHIIRDSFNLLL